MLNKIMLIGRLGADPELRYTPSGDPVTNFNLATSRSYTDNSSGERVVYVEGRFESREYVGADGQNRRAYGVIANSVQFLGGQQDNNQNQEIESKENIENNDNEPQNKNNDEPVEDLPW